MNRKNQDRPSPEKVRIFLATPTGPSGNRTGFYKLVQEVQEERHNGYDLIGEFIAPRTETEVPTGAVMIKKTPAGSNRYQSHTWALALVPEDGTSWEWSEPVSHRRFLTFRDQVKKALEQTRNPENNPSREETLRE